MIPRRLNFKYRHFGTPCSIFIDDVSREKPAYTTYEDWRVFRNVGI